MAGYLVDLDVAVLSIQDVVRLSIKNKRLYRYILTEKIIGKIVKFGRLTPYEWKVAQILRIG